MAYTRRDIRGGAVQTTITSSITNADVSCVIASSTGWPDGSVGGFFVVIDPGLASEEKILCSTRSGTTVNFTTRGADGSSASSHASGATIYPCVSKTDLDEANLAVSKTIGQASAVGQILVVDAANSFAAVQGKTSGNILQGNGTTVVSNAVTGDVTIDGTGATTIGSQKVGISKMTVSASPRLLGRTTASAGAAEELTVDTSLGLSGGVLQRAALTGDVTASAGSNATAIGASKVLTSMIADSNVTTAKIAANAVDSTKIASGSLLTVASAITPTNVNGTLWYDTSGNILYVSNSAGAWVCLTPQYAIVATQQTTTSTSYADLATVGPAVTLTTGTKALVTMSCESTNTGSSGEIVNRMSVAVSGATTIAASDSTAVRISSSSNNNNSSYSATFLINTLTAGSNTFTAKYKASSGLGTATFLNRTLTVVGIP